MDIKVIDKEFAVCKINDVTEVNFNDEFCFVGKTDEELSLVCSSEFVPKNTIVCDSGWRAFRIEGILDFSHGNTCESCGHFSKCKNTDFCGINVQH